MKKYLEGKYSLAINFWGFLIFIFNMITTVIGAYPKPNYLKITDWFNAKGGTDNPNPTKFYTKEIKDMFIQ